MDLSLSDLLHRFDPAAMFGGATAFPHLARIDVELSRCQRLQAAVRVLDQVRPILCECLLPRFGSPAAEALTLKIVNLFLARYHFVRRSAVLMSRPFGLIVDPSNACQLACPGCVHSAHNESRRIFDWPSGTLPETRLSALLKLYGPHAIGVMFCNYGEPLLNLNTPNFVRLAKTYLLNTALSTSLSVRRFDAEAYVESGLDSMVLSIDGATQPVYQRFRRNGDLALVCRNIQQLVAAKRRLRKQTPVLTWNFLAFEHNAQEIPLARNMARRLGVNNFRVAAPFDVTWDDPAIRPAAVKNRVENLDRLAARPRHGNWNPFPSSLDSDAILRAFGQPWTSGDGTDSPSGSGPTCHWLYKNIAMDARGRIMPCCGAPRPDADLVFGSFDGCGSDPFNAEKYRQARMWFGGDASPSPNAPHCTRCDWDHERVNIGGPEIRHYFRAADRSFFDWRSLRLLSR